MGSKKNTSSLIPENPSEFSDIILNGDSAPVSDKDFYELLSYATNFIAKSKMIEVYIK